MATNYPSGLDSLSNPAGSDALSTGHASQHANANDAIEAIEGELGLNPRGGSATVKARFDAIEANSWVTSARILDGTIVNGDVSASAAIDPSKVAQNVVTFSNADAVVATSTRKLVQIGTMSAPRTVTLPAASGVPAGTELVVADLSGSVTTTNTIVVSRAGSDTVNGATSTTIGAAYGWRRFVSDGSSKWVFDGGVHRTSDTGTVTSTNILDGTIVNADINASAAIDVSKLSGVVSSASVGNLLTTNQASVETGTTGFNDPFQCTLARTTAAALSGSASLLVTSTSTTLVFFTPLGTSGVPVTAGRTYTATASAKAVGNSGSGRVTIRWHNAGGSTISDVNGSYTTITSAGWTQLSPLVAVAPADAAFATVYFSVGGINNADAFYFDCFGFWQGAGGLWALPGTPIANLGTYTDESVGRRIFTWDTVNLRWQMTYGDTGWRDVSASINAANGFTGGAVYLRRSGYQVTVAAYGLTRAAGGAGDFYTFLSGWLAGFPLYGRSFSNNPWYVNGASAYISMSGTIDAGAGGVHTTNDAWPSSLPGTASGSIPQ